MARRNHTDWPLFAALCLFFAVPFLYQCVRTGLIAAIPDTDGLGIAGHIEWFDLVNETVQAFLVVPLYYLLGVVREDRPSLKGRLRASFLVSTVLYAALVAAAFLSCSGIVSVMTGGADAGVVRYLRLESIGFVLGHISGFAAVVFVVVGKPSYIMALTVGKAVMTVFSDLVLIPAFGVDGVAYSNITVNAVAGIVCFGLIEFREFRHVIPVKSSGWIIRWAGIGLFSGGQILLDNLIYALIVCRMVNDVAGQGDYWVANNFIWGCLLVPVLALSEIIKRENDPGRFRKYASVSVAIAVCWVVSIPVWKPFFRYAMGIGNPDNIFRIVLMLLPFYVAYEFSSICAGIFTAAGKTAYNCIISAVVNIGYYGVMYALYLRGIFCADMTFICCLFGGGMAVNAICGMVLLRRLRKTLDCAIFQR